MMDELTKRLATDLDAAFPLLVTEAGPGLYWGLRGICGDDHAAEDLTQEAFIRAYKALEGYPPARIRELRLWPWLWTIALNLGRNHLRDRSRRPVYAPEADRAVEDPEVVDVAAWDRRFVGLTRPQRTAVVLRHLVGMGIGEIAETTGRPEGTVKADIHRGLRKLRENLESES